MISKELMKKYQVKNAWISSKKDDRVVAGFTNAGLGECTDGKWLVVVDSEVLILNTRATATKRIRERDFWTRMSRSYRSKP